MCTPARAPGRGAAEDAAICTSAEPLDSATGAAFAGAAAGTPPDNIILICGGCASEWCTIGGGPAKDRGAGPATGNPVMFDMRGCGMGTCGGSGKTEGRGTGNGRAAPCARKGEWCRHDGQNSQEA